MLIQAASSRMAFNLQFYAAKAMQQVTLRKRTQVMSTILLVVLILLLLGALPVYPYSRSWGGAPSGGIGLLLIILIILILMGRI